MSVESTGCVSAKILLPEVLKYVDYRVLPWFNQALHLIKEKAIKFDKLLTEELEKIAKRKEKEAAEKLEKEKASKEKTPKGKGSKKKSSAGK